MMNFLTCDKFFCDNSFKKDFYLDFFQNLTNAFYMGVEMCLTVTFE